MSQSKRKQLDDISLVVSCEGKQVFSGTLSEAKNFEAEDQAAYRAELFGEDDLPVVSMDYSDLRILLR